MLSTVLELAGFALIVGAAYLVAVPLACLVAGLGLVFVAQGLERKPEQTR